MRVHDRFLCDFRQEWSGLLLLLLEILVQLQAIRNVDGGRHTEKFERLGLLGSSFFSEDLESAADCFLKIIKENFVSENLELAEKEDLDGAIC